MNLSLFLKIKSVIFILSGIALVLIVPKFMPLYGIELDPSGMLMGRWCGACLIGLGVIAYYSSAAGSDLLLRGVLKGLFITDAIAFSVSLLGKIQNTASVFGWVSVGFWLAMGLTLGYYLFIKK